MVQTEQLYWLLHLQPWLPVPGTDTTLSQTEIYERILAEAGGNLLFLQPFLRPHNDTTWTWEKAYRQYLHSQQRKNAIRHLNDFINASTKSGNLRDVLAMWLCCTRRSRVADNRELYDARYFWVDDDDVGHTVCGLVDAFVLREVERQPDGDISVTNSNFMRIIRTSIGNRSAQGFLVERSVLAFLRKGDVLLSVLQRLDLLPADELPIRPRHSFFSVEA